MTPTYRARYLASPAPLYYEQLAPDDQDHPVIVLVHGATVSGYCYMTTPDGRPGWAHDFLDHGYAVVVPDLPGIGRSAGLPPDELSGELVCAALGALLDQLGRPVVLLVHSMSGPYGFRLVETHSDRIRALVAVAPGPPGNIQPVASPGPAAAARETGGGPALIGQLSFPLSGTWRPNQRFVRDKLIGLRATRFPVDALEAFTASLLPTPVALLRERQNADGTQLRVHRGDGFAGKPILVLTGAEDLDHSREADGATAQWLAGLGADVEYRFLGDLGITGNSHMLMADDNSHEIAAGIIRWLGERARADRP